MEYKGFNIIEDKMLGFSVICKKGKWCGSALTPEKHKEWIDKISKP